MAKPKYITETSDGYALLDKYTGEVLEYKQVKKVNVDEFIKVYLASIPEMFSLPGQQLKILMAIWKVSSFNEMWETEGNIFLNDKDFKMSIRKMGLDLSNATIDTALHNLTKAGFISRIGKGKYMLNPHYFFKGTLSGKSKLKFEVYVEPESHDSVSMFTYSTPTLSTTE
jgi:hypothetical protein